MLTIELVPKSSWYINVRSEVSAGEWDILRRSVYKKAKYKCECCGGKGPRWPVECHEIWEYDDEGLIQKLTGMTALCPSCHEVKHIGLAQVRGRGKEATKHLANVNSWSIQQATTYIDDQFKKWRDRGTKKYEIDLSFLDDYKTEGGE